MLRFPTRRIGCLFLLLVLSIGVAEEPKSKSKLPTDPWGDPLPVLAKHRLGTLRLRHAQPIRQVVFSSDGKYLATSGADETVRVWDVQNGKSLALLSKVNVGYASSTSWIKFCNSEQTLAILDDRYQFRLWDWKNDHVLVSKDIDPLHAATMSIAPDGKRLARRTADGTMEIVNLLDEATTPYCKAIERPLQRTCFSPDGKFLAILTEQELIVFDPSQSGHDKTWKIKGEEVVFGPQGWLAIWNEKRIELYQYDKTDRLLVIEFPKGELLTSLHFSQDGKQLYADLLSENQQKGWRVWDTATGKATSFLNYPGSIGAIVPARNLLARVACKTHHTVQIWEYEKKVLLHNLDGHPQSVEWLSFTSDSKYLLSVGHEGLLWELATGKKVRMFGSTGYGPRFAAYFPKSANLFTFDPIRHQGNGFRITDGEEIPVPEIPSELKLIPSLAVAPDNQSFALAGNVTDRDNYRGYEVQVIHWPSGQSKFLIKLWEPVESLAISPNGNELLTAQKNGAIDCWDIVHGKRLRSLSDAGSSFLLTPNGRYLISLDGGDMYIIAYPALKILRRRLEESNCLACSPDSRFLFLGKADGTVRWIELVSGREVLLLQPNAPQDLCPIDAIAVSPDGNWLACGCRNTTIVLWDLKAIRCQWNHPQRTKEQLWADLWSEEARVAQRAVHQLCQQPDTVASWLGERVQERDKRISPEMINKLLQQLDSPRFRVREYATQELTYLGRELIQPYLDQKLKAKISAEMMQRIETLQERFAQEPKPTALFRKDGLCIVRGIQILETIGNDTGRKVLQSMAQKETDPQIQEEVQHALERLRK